jgi:hypothetical protein
MASQDLLGILALGIWNLPFDLAQGGELVEPFVICDLIFGAWNFLYSKAQL